LKCNGLPYPAAVFTVWRWGTRTWPIGLMLCRSTRMKRRTVVGCIGPCACPIGGFFSRLAQSTATNTPLGDLNHCSGHCSCAVPSSATRPLGVCARLLASSHWRCRSRAPSFCCCVLVPKQRGQLTPSSNSVDSRAPSGRGWRQQRHSCWSPG